ncbi:MAG: hypothetical protein WBW44_11960, partial [Solirubrobacterales bacterium]
MLVAVACFFALSVPAASAAPGYHFDYEWGSWGNGNGQFKDPVANAIDPAGNVYVADFDNDRIQKFTSEGTFITKWGGWGTGNGQFRGPNAIATDAAGNVYVTD